MCELCPRHVSSFLRYYHHVLYFILFDPVSCCPLQFHVVLCSQSHVVLSNPMLSSAPSPMLSSPVPCPLLPVPCCPLQSRVVHCSQSQFAHHTVTRGEAHLQPLIVITGVDLAWSCASLPPPPPHAVCGLCLGLYRSDTVLARLIASSRSPRPCAPPCDPYSPPDPPNTDGVSLGGRDREMGAH